jgi:transposase-like protein
MAKNEVFELPSQENMQTDLRELCRGAVRVVLELTLEEELKNIVGAKRFERAAARHDHRNGTYMRRLMTSMGHVDLQVPRSRQSGSAGGVLGRYNRRTDDVDDAITSAYVCGISSRDMQEVTTALMGESVSRSTVSRVAKKLDEQISAMRGEKIDGPVPYLYLDATYVKMRWARQVGNVAAFIAYAVGPDGYRKPLGVMLGAEEDADVWTEFLGELVGRGLTGVRLVIADAHKAIGAAVRHHLPEAEQQRCLVHFERNVLKKAPKRLRKRLGKELSYLFAAESRKDAKARLEAFEAGLGSQLPESLECLKEGFTAATVFYDFPKAHWRFIRTTNGLERLNREVKRRTDKIGAFPDRASALRLIVAVVLKATRSWAYKQYLDVKLLEPKSLKKVA